MTGIGLEVVGLGRGGEAAAGPRAGLAQDDGAGEALVEVDACPRLQAPFQGEGPGRLRSPSERRKRGESYGVFPSGLKLVRCLRAAATWESR